VAKAAVAEACESDAFRDGGTGLCEIVFPAIVVDGLMYECYLNENGEMCLEQVLSGTLTWRNSFGGHPHTIIRVMSKDDLEDFAEQASKSILAFFDVCSDAAAGLSQKQ
jgi:hypothetical protein